MTMRSRQPVVLAGMLSASFFASSGRVLSGAEPTVNWVNGVGNSLSQPSDFYGSKEALRIAETVLLYQRDNGGWPKNYDRARELTNGEKQKIGSQKKQNDATIDNGSTHSEVRYLAKVYNTSRDERQKQAFTDGVEFLLKAQYENGGWPQSYPNASGYAKHITFNDDVMIGVMTALRDIAHDRASYSFVDAELRTRCAEAVSKGIGCVLKCQIEVNGRKTAWCAQHDERTLVPRKARSYELASISGCESVSIVRFLMEIDKPTPEVIQAVQGAVEWFDTAKLTGIRQIIQKEDNSTPKGWDKVVVTDLSAPPIWARFYEIGAITPIFCSRDGVPRATLAEISYERRNRYSWLGYYATDLLAKEYPAWQKRWMPRDNVLQESAEGQHNQGVQATR